MSMSSQNSQSTSNSSPVAVQGLAEEPFLLQLANQAQQLEQAQYQWGQQQFSNNSQLTDGVVNNYLTGASTAFNQATNDLSRYDNMFQPEENQLLSDANSYASTNRQQEEMGRAEATAGQSADANRAGAIRDLQSYGIDPSAGRFASLDRAEAMQRAASQAGAANQARANTEATGRSLRSEAIQVGQRYPGQVANELNLSMQGNAGAENATLSNTAEGEQLLGNPQVYGQTAAGLKYPPTGQQSASQSTGSSSSTGAQPGQSSPSRSSSPGGSQSSPGDMNAASGTAGDWNPSAYGGAPGAGSSSGDGGSFNTDMSDIYGGAVTDPGAWDYLGGNGGFQSDPWAAGGGQADPSAYMSGVGGDTTTTGGWDASVGGDASGFGSGSYYDPSAAGGDFGSSDESFAQGGEVDPSSTTGGYVPTGASPTAGQQTDDVPARLNAGEFVMPRDATEWYGQKFFHDLINKSRKLRQQVTAKPQMKPAPAAAPAFASHRMG